MKTSILILISTFLMAACSSQQSAGTGQTRGPVVASFSPTTQDTVEVQVTDREPVTQAELAAPDGRVFPAEQIDRERVSRPTGYGQPSFGLGFGLGVGTGGHTGVGTGVGVGFPLGIGGSGQGDAQVASTARIRVPDMAAYRAQWQQWKLRVYLGDGESRRMIEVAAPQPPAG
jgi:hypothetical protein